MAGGEEDENLAESFQSPPQTLRKRASPGASLKVSEVQSEILKVEYPSEAKREDQRRIEDNIFENIYQV